MIGVMTNNPLIEKYNELYHPKKEEPKPQKLKTTYTKDELEALSPYVNTISSKVTPSNNYITATNASVSSIPITSYDPYSGENSFLQIAEKVKTRDAKVTSVTISRDGGPLYSTGLQTIIFEVRVYDYP